MRADVNKLKVTGSAWKFQEGNLDPLPNNALLFDLLTMSIAELIIDGEEVEGIPTTAQPLYHMISVSIDNELAQIKLGKPFNIQAISVVDKGKSMSKDQEQQEFPIADKLDDNEQGIPLALERPKFPHCFPPTDSVRAGEDARIKIEGLLPNAKIHGDLGPVPVFNGTADSNGGGKIDSFPIPPDTKEGLHLVTIGVDDTAFTADCVINVSENKDIEDSDSQRSEEED
jgi:hypothetical protein